jgi:putative SbcD/Mre11-related phosphoesterase
MDLLVYENYSIDNSLITHGDKIPTKLNDFDVENIVIGHEHPCIGLRSGERIEKIKCYLKGIYKDWNLIVMPSFNFVTEGSDILQEKPLSPFLKKINMEELEVYGIEDFEVFSFGKVKNITAFKDLY